MGNVSWIGKLFGVKPKPAPLNGDDFELRERIFPADTEMELRFTARSRWAKKNLPRVEVGYIRDDARYMHGDPGELHPGDNDYEILPHRIEGDTIVVPHVILRGEFRHAFVIDPPVENWRQRHAPYPVMSLAPDAFGLRPYKGGIHQHSSVSDGVGTPSQQVGYARAGGFDFVSVTDHAKYAQNAEAIGYAAETGCGLEVYVGEEMHSPATVLHSICLGAPEAMSRLKRDEEFARDIAPELTRLREEYPDAAEYELQCIAEALWLIARARKSGAKLLVYCHPQWIRRSRIHAFPLFNEYMLRRADFDAIEAINGYAGKPSHRNMVNAAMLYEMAAETGRKRAFTYGSDSHQPETEWFYKRNWNLIFAPDASLDSFCDAVKSFHSVCGIADRVGETLFYGPSRFVSYARFLRDIDFFGEHDRLAQRQAELLRKYCAGVKSLKPEIEELARAITESTERYFWRGTAASK